MYRIKHELQRRVEEILSRSGLLAPAGGRAGRVAYFRDVFIIQTRPFYFYISYTTRVHKRKCRANFQSLLTISVTNEIRMDVDALTKSALAKIGTASFGF
jgi:hypothetical protein